MTGFQELLLLIGHPFFRRSFHGWLPYVSYHLESPGAPQQIDSTIKEARQTLNGDELIQQFTNLEAHQTFIGVAANPRGGEHIFSIRAANPVNK